MDQNTNFLHTFGGFKRGQGGCVFDYTDVTDGTLRLDSGQDKPADFTDLMDKPSGLSQMFGRSVIPLSEMIQYVVERPS